MTATALWVGVTPVALAAPLGTQACPAPEQLFPGTPLGTIFFSRRGPQPPRSAHCERRDDSNCQFIDRFGIDNTLTEWRDDAEGPYRMLYQREQVRARGGSLPYGVTWSDSYRDAMAKLRPHGAKALPRAPMTIGLGCADWGSNGYGVDFNFDASGRLKEVVQWFQAY